jgi:hypothetical protein
VFILIRHIFGAITLPRQQLRTIGEALRDRDFTSPDMYYGSVYRALEQ